MEYEIEGLEEIDHEVERLTKRYDRYYENAAFKQMQKSIGRPRKKVNVVEEYKLERERIFRNGGNPKRRCTQMSNKTEKIKLQNEESNNGLSLPFDEAVGQAEAAFKVSGVLHMSFLAYLNTNISLKLYNYFFENFPCKEIRKGTLKLIDK